MKKKEYIESMRRAGNVKFRSFIVSIILLTLVWFVTLVPGYLGVAEFIMNVPGEIIYVFILLMLGMWKILSFMFFLVPALSYWWEMSVAKRK